MRLSPYQLGGYKYTTPGGHRYSLQMRPKPSQEVVLHRIVDYGFSVGASEETIAIAAVSAYQESSLGLQATNAHSSALGVFQFTSPAWSDHFKHLNRESLDDQITAMYDRINFFRPRYTKHLSDGTIDGAMTFPEYAYANHKQGEYKPQEFATRSDTQDALAKFRDKWLILGLHIE